MKRVISSIIALTLFSAAVFAADWKSPITFDSYEWNFGSINPAEGTVCHTFTFTNTSRSHVTIHDDIPSCECIAAYYDGDSVAPGEKAEVMIAYSPKKDRGKSYRRVELTDRDGNTLASLSIVADVAEPSAVGNEEYPYLDTSLSYAERTENLISLLTAEEKVGLMMNKSVSVDRLGIPSYNWWSEACHGVRQDGYTVYPQPIGMAAAFNAEMVYDVFSTVSQTGTGRTTTYSMFRWESYIIREILSLPSGVLTSTYSEIHAGDEDRRRAEKIHI